MEAISRAGKTSLSLVFKVSTSAFVPGLVVAKTEVLGIHGLRGSYKRHPYCKTLRRGCTAFECGSITTRNFHYNLSGGCPRNLKQDGVHLFHRKSRQKEVRCNQKDSKTLPIPCETLKRSICRLRLHPEN
eukprot:1778368-Rhodomonas_salina.3